MKKEARIRTGPDCKRQSGLVSCQRSLLHGALPRNAQIVEIVRHSKERLRIPKHYVAIC